MTDPPVSASEIADLLHHIRDLSDHPTSNLTDRTEVLARKADLLARLAARHADEWVCEHADQARQLAHQAQIPPPRPASPSRQNSATPSTNRSTTTQGGATSSCYPGANSG